MEGKAGVQGREACGLFLQPQPAKEDGAQGHVLSLVITSQSSVTYSWVHLCLYVHVCAHVFVCLCTCVHARVCMQVCMSVCTRMCRHCLLSLQECELQGSSNSALLFFVSIPLSLKNMSSKYLLNKLQRKRDKDTSKLIPREETKNSHETLGSCLRFDV